MPYGFYLDSSTCTGCKACQAACKDKHGLPAGVLWRRVYEVTGGGWSRVGAAWVSTVFAYNLSLACNHCANPICVEVCPVAAYTKRPDGIVLLDTTRCIGCRYCTWACPYGAPQYDEETGQTSKCDLCADEIDAGRPPTCVAACPLRALDFGEVGELQERHRESSTPSPLPDSSLTLPALVVKPHVAAERAEREPVRVANREEIRPAEEKREWSLVIFTILGQLAVGLFWISGLLDVWLADRSVQGAPEGISAGWAIALAMAMAMLASLFHLGRPPLAWRALSNLHRSWLSREILFAALFTAAMLLLAGADLLGLVSSTAREIFAPVVGLLGFALVYCMGRTYRLSTISAWNTWVVPVSFFVTALLLGAVSASMLLSVQSPSLAPLAERRLLAQFLGACAAALLAIQLGLIPLWQWRLRRLPATVDVAMRSGRTNDGLLKLRLALAVVGLLAVMMVIVDPATLTTIVAFGAVLASEVSGRALFYGARSARR